MHDGDMGGTEIVLEPSSYWTTRVVPPPFCTVPFVMRECDTGERETEPLVILL